MHLHEYQSKELLRAYGLPIGDFRVSTKALGIGKFAYELAPGPFELLPLSGWVRA